MGTMAQIKFTIDSDIVSAFKARCVREGVSMTSMIQQYMETCKPTKAAKTKMLTRPQRKKAVAEITGILNSIMEFESEYRDNIPEQFTQRQETADNSCSRLEEAIACLEEAF